MSEKCPPFFEKNDEDNFLPSDEVVDGSVDKKKAVTYDSSDETPVVSATNSIVTSPSSNSLASSCSATRKHRPGSVLDGRGYRLRAGCIAVESWGGKVHILLAASTRHKNQWVVPAGGVEKGESTREAAVREAREEAGVECVDLDFLGEFMDDLKQTRTSVWIGEAGKINKNVEERNVAWFTLDEAQALPPTKVWQQQAIAAAADKLLNP